MNFTWDKYLAPRTIEKMKIIGSHFGATSYLNSTAIPAHLPQNWAKLAKWAVLFSW